jgi:two-component system NtrC family sensor kinase
VAKFLSEDPKGKLIPEFLSTVAAEMAGEQQELIARMDTVGEHIEHIKEIVEMQQSYAKVSGVYENLSATMLVEDALRINAAAFERHSIELVREFEDNTPAVCVDRHKVLQILINLFRNAKHALQDKSEVTRRLVVQVRKADPDTVRITVLDNGIGIPPENITKIFNHGFTTKKEGHGFGLHSGANAAKQMGGSLVARSDGPGRGAEFVLDLPTTLRHQKETPVHRVHHE